MASILAADNEVEELELREIPNSEDEMGSQEGLICRNGNTSVSSEVQQTENDSVQFDDILKRIGEFGPWQRAIYILSCVFVLIPSGLHTAGVPFITGTPKFQCATPDVECEVNKCCKNCTNYAFIGPYAYNSTVTEYNLICDRAFIGANVQAVFGAGMLLGSFIFGAVSDNFGRRSCMLLCSVLMTLFSLGASFAKSLVLFSVLRFCTAACLTGFFVAHYVYVLELVGPTYRTMASKCCGFFWAAGSGAIALMGYYIRDWRTLLLVSSCPPALFLLLWLIIPESGRWLLVRGRVDEAGQIVRKFAKKNSIMSDYLNRALAKCSRGEILARTRKIRHSPLDLFRTPRMRKRTLILWFCWLVVNLIYYGFLFYVSDLPGSPYLNMIIIYVVIDTPGIFLCWVTVQKFGRRVPFCVFMIIGGVACLLVLIVPKDEERFIRILAFIGRGFVTMSFSILYLYSSELYPTSIRNLAVGTCSTIARLGFILASYIVMLSQLPGLSVIFPMVVFGALALTAGLVILWLPETLNSNMCQTLDETNRQNEYYGFIWMERRVNIPFSFSRLRSPGAAHVRVVSNEGVQVGEDSDGDDDDTVDNAPLIT